LKKLNKQQEFWHGQSGTEWARTRNSFNGAYYSWQRDANTTLKKVLDDALGEVLFDTTILELGCNDGWVLKTLQDLGYTNLSGLDINVEACVHAGENLPTCTIYHQALEASYPVHDMIMTSALLIHIHPDNLSDVMENMYICSEKYIFGRELSSVKPVTQGAKGTKWYDQYWTRRFKDKFLEMFPQLRVKYYDLLPMVSRPDVQTEVYLLEKPTQDY